MQNRSRRPAREAALRALYQMQVGNVSMERSIGEMRENATFDPDLVNYAEALIRGVNANGAALKGQLTERLKGWDYERLAIIDKLVLLVGAFELLHSPEVPPVVAMNEAIEIAKKYSTAESGKFVNGVLAKINADFPRAVSGRAAEEAPVDAHDDEPEPAEEQVDDPEEIAKLERTGALKPVAKGPQ